MQRCVSDPTPVLGFPVSSPESKIGNSPAEETPKTKTASLPPRRINPMLRHRRRIEAERIRRRKSGDASSEEKVKKMKEIMGVTSQWLSQIAQEDEPQRQDEEGCQDTHVAETPKVFVYLSLLIYFSHSHTNLVYVNSITSWCLFCK